MNLAYNDLIKISKTLTYTGPEIRVTEHLPTETVQKRRHKRKSSRRWQKKWKKRFGTKQVVKNEIYQIGNMILVSPEMYKKVITQIQKANDDYFRERSAELWGIKVWR